MPLVFQFIEAARQQVPAAQLERPRDRTFRRQRVLGYLILILTGLIVGAILYWVWLSTTLTSKQTRMLNAWAHVDAQLKHRHDAVRDLVTAMRNYLTHDNQTLEEVSRDRLN